MVLIHERQRRREGEGSAPRLRLRLGEHPQRSRGTRLRRRRSMNAANWGPTKVDANEMESGAAKIRQRAR